MPYKDLVAMTPEQVAECLGLKPPTVRAMLRSGRLKGFKTGSGPKSQWRVLVTELERFVGEVTANA